MRRSISVISSAYRLGKLSSAFQPPPLCRISLEFPPQTSSYLTRTFASSSSSSSSKGDSSGSSSESGGREPPSAKGFIPRLLDSVRDEIKKSKELQENLERLRKDRDRMEQSDVAKQARIKWEVTQAEMKTHSERLLDLMKKLEEATRKQIAEIKATKYGDTSLKLYRDAMETIEKGANYVGDMEAMKKVGDGARAIKREIDEIALSRAHFYQRPEVLRKRSERSSAEFHSRSVEPNMEATSIDLHKDTRWFQSWRSVAENNQYINRLWDWKTKYDESENPVIRTTRFFTDKLSSAFGGMLSNTQMSDVLTEICKVDPSFDRDEFIKECEKDIVPNVLEAMIRGDIEVLKDWCSEAVYKPIEELHKRVLQLGYQVDSKVIDMSHVELAMGKIMDQGPVLIITFFTQQIECVREKTHKKVVEGDPNKPMKVNWVWVLCRDQEELNPKAAWRVLEVHQSAQPLFL